MSITMEIIAGLLTITLLWRILKALLRYGRRDTLPPPDRSVIRNHETMDEMARYRARLRKQQ